MIIIIEISVDLAGYALAGGIVVGSFAALMVADLVFKYQTIKRKDKMKNDNFNKLLERIEYFDKNGEHQKERYLDEGFEKWVVLIPLSPCFFQLNHSHSSARVQDRGQTKKSRVCEDGVQVIFKCGRRWCFEER